MLSCVSPRKVSFQPLQATMLELPNGLATINLGNVPGEYIDNVRPPQDGGGCPHNKIWNECGNSCNDSYCVCDDTCGDLVCTMACEPRCECPEGMVPSPANADLCVSPAEVCSDMITTPSPPTTVAPTPIWTTAGSGCPAGCVEEDHCEKPAPITCPPNEHWTECNYCTEMNCQWGMACARSCFEGGDCCVEKNKCVCNDGYARYTPGE